FVTMSRRATGDCLAEELRHLDPDRAFGHALRGLVRVNRPDRRGMYSKAMRANSEYFDGPAHTGDTAYDQASMR
ncbi:glucose-6-phosphate dehydrogenase assembly protein OpcA, partial [Klebsiella pneumoniae]|nr:glucose-6-phosphate dehydrogenase assembly protein OpcA [Klebsiella pneumoniae]